MMMSDHATVRSGICALIALAVLGIALVGSIPVAAESEVPDDYTDMGDFYSMTCRFVYTGEGADTVTWDFGDGSEPEEGKIVDHEFVNKGVYYVKQTSTNDIGSTVAYYKVQINGFPTVTYNMNGHGDNIIKAQSAYCVPAEKPADPTADGLTFMGWYTDAKCTVQYTGEGIDAPTTLYAKWIGSNGNDVVIDDDHHHDENDGSKTMIIAGVGIVGMLVLIGGAVTRHPIVAIAGIAIVGMTVIFHCGVIEWPF